MKLSSHTLHVALATFGLLLANSAALAAAPTAPLNLAPSPLANSSSTVVKPNIMFTMDDSGSMGDTSLPDWASSSNKKLARNAGYNALSYNPSIVYTKPVFFTAGGALDTTTYPDQTGMTAATGASTASKPNWEWAKIDGYGVQDTGTDNLTYKANYYTFIAGEYCATPTLESCIAATAPSDAYPYAANLRWCTASNLSTCRALRNGSSYSFARYPAMGNITATITISGTNSATAINSIVVDGREILSGIATTGSSDSNLASKVTANINACTSTLSGNCTIYGYSAVRSNNVITISSPNSGYTYSPVVSKTGNGTANVTAFTAASTLGYIVYTAILPNHVYNYPGTNAKHPNRTDCAGTSCTYAEEMTNYANWFAYYQTRMQAMKTSVGRAFKALNQNYRVGYNTIGYTGVSASDNRFLNPATFELAQKYNWYTKMYSTTTPSYTPLRGAVSKIGRYYAKRFYGQVDPVQYSCQQNFHILSTDGYWNTNAETSSYGPFKVDSNTAVGNLDGGSTLLPYKEGVTASNTLADVAKYYYDTDLRTSALDNCTGALGTGTDVCENNVFVSIGDSNAKQHVTQFTMGLGIDGTLMFQTDYLTAASGDYFDLKHGYNNKRWPDPINNSNEERIDDLWHAAVNGNGTYFSAKDPDSIIQGFTSALNAIAAKTGAGAAAATSTLNPVAGDNTAYVASYTTMKWQGNLEARLINILDGTVSETASWCAENVLPSNCASPGTVEADNTNESLSYYCVTPNASACDDGTMRADGSCAVPIATTCTGTMAARVGALSDTRTIYKANAAGTALEAFNYSNLSVPQKAYFDEAYLTGKLSQLTDYTAPQKTVALGENLVNFIRGQFGYEDRTSNATVGRMKLYRFRETVLADITESQPVFLGKPFFGYADSGYTAFVAAQANRAKTVFVGANDGMLHAFNADTGQERWAFVPTAVIPNLWTLADRQYATKHTNYVNGPPTIGDVYDGTNWRTILVGGLNGGGRAYYALDVTNPASPQLLWELSVSDLSNLGYSYGQPRITKLANGTWVVMFSSGYNNVSPGNGFGYLFVRDAITGAAVKTMTTGIGSTSVPSGLARISVWADDGNVNNTGKYVYGGDLMGNVWRFDPNGADTSGMQFAVLRDQFANPQPITAAPELGLINNKRIVFVGTGKYLEIADLSDTQKQTIYAMKDDDAVTTFNNPRNTLVQQVLTLDDTGAFRTSSNNPVDWFNGRGWFIDFPDPGERVHVDPKLDSGTLFVPTTVPSNTACSPGGYGWLNYFDYKSGVAVRGSGGYVSQKMNAPIVGLNIFYLPSGKRVVGVVTADGPTPKKPEKDTGTGDGFGDFGGLNVMWREIVP